MIYPFCVLGPPRPKERARACPNGKHVTPKKTRNYERLVGSIAGLQRPRQWRLDGYYHVEVRAYFGDARGRDVDNVAKSVLDGLNRVLWNDDRQVRRVVTEKFIDRDQPRIEVVVELIEVPPDPQLDLAVAFAKADGDGVLRLDEIVRVVDDGRRG